MILLLSNVGFVVDVAAITVMAVNYFMIGKSLVVTTVLRLVHVSGHGIFTTLAEIVSQVNEGSSCMNIRQRINMWEHYLGKRRVSFTTTNCSSAMINNNKEENKMTKISMDKKYKMRDGQAVRVLCVDGGGRWPVIVLTSDGGIYRMPADGYYLSNKTESLYDLIEIKPTKQITVDVWINVYPRGTSVGHASKELAESMAFADQIDCFNFKRTYEVEVNSDEE